MEFDEDECPELVPIDIFNNAKDEISDQRVPVTIVTGFLGILTHFGNCTILIQIYSIIRCRAFSFLCQ